MYGRPWLMSRGLCTKPSHYGIGRVALGLLDRQDHKVNERFATARIGLKKIITFRQLLSSVIYIRRMAAVRA